MEPRIQYAKTSDGVSIAYAVFGEGLTLVYTAGTGGVHFYSHSAISRRSVDQLTAIGLQVIRYDGRGTGSSDRNVRNFSLETHLLDLEAVVERLGLERFALAGRLAGAPAAIAYAARRPERVSHLVLRDPWASVADLQSAPATRMLKAMRPMAEEQWELVTLNIAYMNLGFNDSEGVKEFAAASRSATTAATWVALDEAEEKISLGMKQTEQDPWMVLPLKYPVGTRISGKVRNLTSFGAFVEIEPGIDGLIHISDMSWTKRVQHPSEVVKKGDAVDVVILNIDGENKRISLGLKQAQEDPWLRIGEIYPIGMELSGKVLRLMDKGVVVDVGNDIEGFVPMSQLGLPDIENPADGVKEGQPVDLRVLEVDPIHHRIVLAAVSWPNEEAPAELPAQG